MKKLLVLLMLGSGVAYGSGTITPANRVNSCPSSSVVGRIAGVDVERGQVSLLTERNQTQTFKVSKDTVFRIPGLTREDLKASPLAEVPAGAPSKVFYCAKDSTVLELKVVK